MNINVKEKYFFCYSSNLVRFFALKNVEYICKGLNEQNGKRFWLYERTENLEDALEKYRQETIRLRNL